MKKKTIFQTESIDSLDDLNRFLFLGTDDVLGEKDSLFFTKNFDTFIAISPTTYESLKEKYAAERGSNPETLRVINSVDRLIYGLKDSPKKYPLAVRADDTLHESFDSLTSLYGENYGFQRNSEEIPGIKSVSSRKLKPTLYDKVKNYNRRDEIFYRTGTAISNIFSFFRDIKRRLNQ
jgi:hypothetical protein